MTIEDKNKIDLITMTKEGIYPQKVILIITDHLNWESDINEHLFKLQEKLNVYINVIESKNIYKYFPDAVGRDNFLIKIYFKYQIPDECLCFLEKVNEVIKAINTSIEYEIG